MYPKKIQGGDYLNVNKLRSFMALKADTQNVLANYLGITPQRLSAKMNEKNGAEFTQSEINLMKKRYELSAKEIDTIFFAKIVS